MDVSISTCGTVIMESVIVLVIASVTMIFGLVEELYPPGPPRKRRKPQDRLGRLGLPPAKCTCTPPAWCEDCFFTTDQS